LTNGFKLRFFIQSANNFQNLFKPQLKCKTDEWLEVSENEPHFCSYIHVMNRNEKHNISQLPKNNDNLLTFYQNKKQLILNYIQKNQYNMQIWKLKEYFNQDIKNENHFL